MYAPPSGHHGYQESGISAVWWGGGDGGCSIEGWGKGVGGCVCVSHHQCIMGTKICENGTAAVWR